jgi:hypothetical protein
MFCDIDGCSLDDDIGNAAVAICLLSGEVLTARPCGLGE